MASGTRSGTPEGNGEGLDAPDGMVQCWVLREGKGESLNAPKGNGVVLGTPEGNGNGSAPGTSRPTVRQQILTLSPIPKAATPVRNRQAQVAVEPTSSPYKDKLIQKIASRGRGRGATGNARKRASGRARGTGGAGLTGRGERRGVTEKGGARGATVTAGDRGGESIQTRGGNSIKEEGS